MTRICVLSDSHDSTGMLELLALRVEAGEYARVIHLGDVRRDAQWLEARLRRPVAGVAGNCDLLSRDAREIEIKLEGIKILAVHGDKYGVKSAYDRLAYRAEERGCALALFGHTHVPFSGYAGGVLLVNPGALMGGRFAEIEIDGSKIVPRLLKV